MSNPDDPASWMAKAQADMLCIDNNLSAARIPWDVVCYHAQQAAEKALKGCLVACKQVAPRTHDLLRLLTLCVSQGAPLDHLATDCSLLVRLSAPARYPSDSYEPTERDGREAVDAAKRVYAAVLARLETGAP